MAEAPRGAIKKIVDFYRTAPYGETLLILMQGLTIPLISADVATPGGEAFILGLWAVGSLTSIKVISDQFVLAKRLRESLREKGYQEKIFEKVMPEWCDRQTAYVITERYGVLDKFKATMRKNRGKMRFNDIPHF